MTLGYTIVSTLEILGLITLTVGLIFEDKIAAIEERVIKKISARLFHKRVSNVISINCKSHGDKAV